MMNPNHDIYKDGDENIPDSICDGHGQIVLALCKKCGKGEIELNGKCTHMIDPANATKDELLARIAELRGALNDLMQDYEEVCANRIIRQPFASPAFIRGMRLINYKPVSKLRAAMEAR